MIRYHFDNQTKKKKISRTRGVVFVVSGIVIILAVFFLARFVISDLLRGPEWLASSFQIAAKRGITSLTPKRIVLKDNEKLQEELLQKNAELLELESLRLENEELRKQVNYTPEVHTYKTVQVIRKPSASLFNTLVVDAGSSQGITSGQLVVTENNIGIGTVAQVSGSSANVALFGEPRFEGEVLLVHKKITVPAIGKGSGNFEIHVPRELDIAEGDLLAFPQNPDVIIGVVQSISFDARDPFQTVLARIPVNVQELRFVQVVQ